MILINLLPHREAKRLLRRRNFYAGLVLAALVGLIFAGMWYLMLAQFSSEQEKRNQYLQTEIKTLEVQIKDIANLKSEIDSLKARQKAVEDLQTDRNTPVRLLNELVKQTPEGIYLTSIKQVDKTITVTGLAQTNERVSEFIRRTAHDSPWIEKPELVEIKISGQAAGNRDINRLFDFSMRVSVKPPAEPSTSASGVILSPAKAASAPPKKI